jgi:hypothetical protein
MKVVRDQEERVGCGIEEDKKEWWTDGQRRGEAKGSYTTSKRMCEQQKGGEEEGKAVKNADKKRVGTTEGG